MCAKDQRPRDIVQDWITTVQAQKVTETLGKATVPCVPEDFLVPSIFGADQVVDSQCESL